MPKPNKLDLMPEYTKEQEEKLQETLPRLVACAKKQFGSWKAYFDWEDLVQEVYVEVLQRRSWDPSGYPDPFGLLYVRLIGNGINRINRETKRVKILREINEPSPTDSPEDSETEKIREAVRRKQLQMIEAIPGLKRVKEFQLAAMTAGRPKPHAEETAHALGVTVSHIYFLYRKAKKLWELAKKDQKDLETP